MANGEHFSLTFLLFFLLVNGAIWVMTRERLIFSEHGIERVAGIDPHRRVAWEDVTAARVFPGGVILEHRAGRPLRVWNRFLDGCPELAAEMLARLPASVLDANTGNRGMLERQAALLPKAARGRVT